MPKQAEAERLAERRRVDEYMRRKQAGRATYAKKTAPPPKKPTHSDVARKRREAIVKKTAPSGFRALLAALGMDIEE